MPLASEDEFRIKTSFFCLGKSKVFELIQPFQIALFCFCMLTEANSYLWTEGELLLVCLGERKEEAGISGARQ